LDVFAEQCGLLLDGCVLHRISCCRTRWHPVVTCD